MPRVPLPVVKAMTNEHQAHQKQIMQIVYAALACLAVIVGPVVIGGFIMALAWGRPGMCRGMLSDY